ncbi:MAG: ATP-binding protein [Pseudomonadota bacterium]
MNEITLPSLPLTNAARCSTLIQSLSTATRKGLPALGAFYGPSGVGKTEAALMSAMAIPSVTYMRLTAAMTPRDFLRSLADTLGYGYPKQVTANDLLKLICAQLAMSEQMLILDEAEYALPRSRRGVGYLATIRDLHDLSRRPVLLLGKEDLGPNLAQFEEQFDNRIIKYELAVACSLEDARQIAAQIAGDTEITDEWLEAMLSATDGCTRRVAVALMNAKEEADRLGNAKIDASTHPADKIFNGRPPMSRRAA